MIADGMTAIYERLVALAIDIDRAGHNDLAVRASELANEVGNDCVLVNDEGEIPTNAQGVALARFLRGRLTTGSAQVMAGSFGLPTGYLAVFCADGYEGGIAPNGDTST